MKGKLEDSATGPMIISFVLVKLTASLVTAEEILHVGGFVPALQ